MLQIAICDDEKSLAEYLKQLLEKRLEREKDCSVMVFSSGTELLKEVVVIVEGTTEKKEEVVWWQDLDIIEHVNYYIEQGHSPNESIKRVAKERKLAKNEVYRTFHIN